jgi:hypothetical protein
VYVDRNGEVIKSVHIWLPAATHELVKADGLNLSQFVREQLEVLYGEQSTVESLNQRVRLVETARESFTRQRENAVEASANRERLRTVVRQMRADRDAAQVRQKRIIDALARIVGEDTTGRYRRMLPENDLSGDRIEDWEDLVSAVSRRCGISVDSGEVAAELRRMSARG